MRKALVNALFFSSSIALRKRSLRMIVLHIRKHFEYWARPLIGTCASSRVANDGKRMANSAGSQPFMLMIRRMPAKMDPIEFTLTKKTAVCACVR